MESSIFYGVDASVICFALLVLMLVAIVMGNRMRRKYWNAEEGEAKGGVNSLLGALFGLWGFILAFTFGQSGSRFENVRATIVEEANILRTTILKADFFPDSIRTAYRGDLKTYLEERISYYDHVSDEAKYLKNREDISKTAMTLWSRTVQLSKRSDLNSAASGMGNSLTDLFDIGIKREAMLTAGIPGPIAVLLMILALAICLVGGFTTPSIRRKEWIVITMFSILAAMILYITIDLARPMQGLIKPNTGQKTIVDLRRFF